MNIRLIALDLDGTLLNEEKRVSPRNASALSKAAQSGIKVVISSGRIYPEALGVVAGLKDIAAVSACNGGHVVELPRGEVLKAEAMAPASFRELVAILEDFGIFYSVYGSDRIFLRKGIAREHANISRYLEGMSCPKTEAEDLASALGQAGQSPYKVYTQDPDLARLAELRKLLAGRKDLELTSSSPSNIEITAGGVDKGGALITLGRHWGIAPAQMMALGDGENDLAMFAVSGCPVAMGNASPAVKAAALRVTLSNREDGVAEAVEALLAGRA
jgi:Cof subfamily protein (haloacid dehalogenase superfamily)